MKTIMAFFLVALTSILLVLSCSKKNEEELGGNNGGNNDCDTTNMSYSTHIVPILQASCFGCHGNGQASGGVNLSTYNGVKTVADNGSLVGSISHASGFSHMPKGGAKLPQCTINKVDAWVKRGAPNN